MLDLGATHLVFNQPAMTSLRLLCGLSRTNRISKSQLKGLQACFGHLYTGRRGRTDSAGKPFNPFGHVFGKLMSKCRECPQASWAESPSTTKMMPITMTASKDDSSSIYKKLDVPFTRILHACRRLSCHKHIGAPPNTIRLTSLTSRSWIASRAPIASTPSSIRTSSQTATPDLGISQGLMSTIKEDSHHQGTPKQDSHTSCKHMRFSNCIS